MINVNDFCYGWENKEYDLDFDALSHDNAIIENHHRKMFNALWNDKIGYCKYCDDKNCILRKENRGRIMINNLDIQVDLLKEDLEKLRDVYQNWSNEFHSTESLDVIDTDIPSDEVLIMMAIEYYKNYIIDLMRDEVPNDII